MLDHRNTAYPFCSRLKHRAHQSKVARADCLLSLMVSHVPNQKFQLKKIAVKKPIRSYYFALNATSERFKATSENWFFYAFLY